MTLPSTFQIGDKVVFHTRKSKKGTGVLATVTAVKFTKKKVRYSLDIAGAGPEVHEIDQYFVSAPACTK